MLSLAVFSQFLCLFSPCFSASFPSTLPFSFDLEFLLQKGESPPATTLPSQMGHEEKSRLACAIQQCGRGPQR